MLLWFFLRDNFIAKIFSNIVVQTDWSSLLLNGTTVFKQKIFFRINGISKPYPIVNYGADII